MELSAYVCSHVFANSHPVLLVSRVEGDWQFLCGETHEGDEVPQVVGLNHLFDRDPTLHELHDLPPDWQAERATVASPWRKTSLV
jgi:hypothetical protein